MRIESSIITSLSELRAIEQQRISDERAAIERDRAAEIEARRAAEQARVDAEQRRLREEREAIMRVEQMRLDAEREARMRVEAAEAAERARLQAAIEQQRMVEEVELRRAEIAKKRPTWMLVVTGIALAATIGLGWYAVDQAAESARADEQRIAADNQTRAAQEDAKRAREELDRFAKELEALDAIVADAGKKLGAAQKQADRDAAAAAITAANLRSAELRKQQADAERRRWEAERKGGFIVDPACLHGSIDCIDGKPRKNK
jgi:hypothetical protein